LRKNDFKVKKNKKHHPVLFAVIMFICLTLIGIVILLNSKLLAPPNNITSSGNNSVVSTAPTIKDKVSYYLICGVNDYMTDIIMLVCFDKAQNKATVLQIPRDSYVGDESSGEYGIPTGKINAVYNHNGGDANGMNKLIQYINRDFGLPVDHFVYFNPTGFVKTVDIVGGVEVDVPYNLELNGVTLYKGKQSLNGKKAEVLVRSRTIYNPTTRSHSYYPQGDIGRLQVQKQFLASFMMKVKNMSAKQLTSIIPNVFSNFKSDMTVSEIIDLGNLAHKLNLNNVEIYTLPGEGVMNNGSSVYSIHKAEANVLINGKFNPYGEQIKLSDMQIPEIVTSSSTTDSNNSLPSLQEIINQQNLQ
jgi:LCP family protein required for cell wall assembly